MFSFSFRVATPNLHYSPSVNVAVNEAVNKFIFNGVTTTTLRLVSYSHLIRKFEDIAALVQLLFP